MEIIKVNNLKKSFGDTEILKGINFTVNEGEKVAIMGSSGCGKTTLLKTIGLIQKPSEGEVYFKEDNKNMFTNDEISSIRLNEIGFVFQDFRLLDSLSVKENIILPMIINKDSEEIMMDRCNSYAKKMDISHLLDKKPCNISGGEKQRTAICRALINNPSIIFADEPTGNLDSKSGKNIIEILLNVNEELNKTLIMVTHDPYIASFCDRVIWLKDGIINEELINNSKENFYSEIMDKMKINTK